MAQVEYNQIIGRVERVGNRFHAIIVYRNTETGEERMEKSQKSWSNYDDAKTAVNMSVGDVRERMASADRMF